MILNSPIDLAHLDQLIRRVVSQSPRTIVDHGCGWGEVLLRVVAATTGATGLGIDLSAPQLERARSSAADRGLDDRVSFTHGSSTDHRRAADVLISLGAYQAFGAVDAALRVLRDDLRPGGRALFGAEYWTRTPTPEELRSMWAGASAEDCLSLPDLVDGVHSAGWRILDLHDSTRTEFDAFELGHLRPRDEWLVTHRGQPVADLRAEQDRRWSSWLRGHRGCMGFVTFVLA